MIRYQGHLYRAAAYPGEWYYRLSSTGNTLPTSWSYGDPDDEQTPGFQVWIYPEHVLAAILGYDLDGTYTSEEGYDRLFLIRAAVVHDSVGAWYAVLPEDVLETRVVEVAPVRAELQRRLERQLGEDWEDDAEVYLSDHSDELHRWLLGISQPADLTFVNTLQKEQQ